MKKNRENTSKHGDACGIYARNRLWACENKFLKKPLPTSPKRKEDKLLEFTALSFIIFHLSFSGFTAHRDVFLVFLHNYSSKRRKQFVSPRKI
jgi:hypothetical protein